MIKKFRSGRITITRYVMLWSILYVLVISVVLIAAISILTDGAIRGAAREELAHEKHVLNRSLYLSEGQVCIKQSYENDNDAFFYCIYDDYGNIITGNLPKNVSPEMIPKHGTEIFKVKGNQYAGNVRTAHLSEKRNSPVVMSDEDLINVNIYYCIDIKKMNTGYRSINLVLTLTVVVASVIMIISQSFFSRRLSENLDELIDNAKAMSSNIDFSDRMEADSTFLEVNVLINTYNRLLDRMERTINRERAFNSSVSHELRTPIAVIKAECEIAREKQRRGYVNVNDVLDLVERQNGRMYSLVNQLLVISRLEQGRIHVEDDEEIDLAELAEIICEEEAEVLDLDSPSDVFEMVLAPAKVTANMTLIMTLYTNLVHNAVKYNKNNNKITVQLYREGKNVFFSVQDWGIGMSEDVRQNIFNSFYRAEKSRTSEGFGLGLTMAGRIAEYYGGSIEVTSEEGLGSTFTASLPLIK